jgi:predicted nuclease of restriction endonuclease-like RecB superfamily
VLPSELARYKIIKNQYIVPLLAEVNEENLFIADSLIKCYEENVNKKILDLNNSIRELEFMANAFGYDFKLVRGLKSLLDRRIRLNDNVDENLIFEIRSQIFELSNKMYKGSVLNENERDKIFSIIAEKYKISKEKVEELFLSVYEDEMFIKGFESISPEELIKQYNLSLLQTILFKCKQLQITVDLTGHDMRLLLWSIKKLGLLYHAENNFNKINLIIDGPLSILKQTERYGTRIAKLIPLILSFKDWSIKAIIVKKFRKIKNFEKNYTLLISKNLASYFPKYEHKEITYDSEVEADLAKKLVTVGGEWQVIREPEPIISGSTIFIPDFALIKGDKKVYLEIVGFWTPDYLKRKLEKIKSLKGINLILAIDESLHEFKIDDVGNFNIIKYNKKVSSIDIIKILKKFE